MKIKVCGMREADNIRAVSQLGIDYMGFIFYPKSPRFVQMISAKAGIIPDYNEEKLRRIVSKQSPIRNPRNPKIPTPPTTPTSPKKSLPARVGVFVDDMPQNIVTRVYNYDLDYVQLHGNETTIMIDNLRRSIDPDIHPGIKIIKALSIAQPEDIAKYKEYEGHVDLFLFDTKCDSKGGSGEKFDWQMLSAYDGNTPFLLSGGIGPDDAERVKAFHHPQCVGIDLNSKFETAPGVKDVELLRKFIKQTTTT